LQTVEAPLTPAHPEGHNWQWRGFSGVFCNYRGFRAPRGKFTGVKYFQLRRAGASRTIKRLDDRPIAERSRALALTCANCGNDRNFQVKTVQMHVVHLEDERVEVSDEGRPAVLEVLCDECENPINFEEFEDALRREVMLTIGAR
jgi:5-methylcytosine-specific restriction endonuclease McrA